MLMELGRGREAKVFAVVRAMRKDSDKKQGERVLAMRVPHKQGRVSLYTRKVCAMPGHPHVVAIVAVDCTSGIVMLEFVGGGTLSDELVCGDLAKARAVAVIEQALRGVAHLHGHGFVHGDVCPSNVLVCESGECKLTDYFVQPDSCATVCGAPAYMAPEAARGGAVSASDVWSVACLMLAVSGRAPWQDADVRLEDGSVVELGCAGALLYHLACREVALRGPPEFAASVACEGLFSDVMARMFTGAEKRASASTLLEMEKWWEM